jgi:hypothetical protein
MHSHRSNTCRSSWLQLIAALASLVVVCHALPGRAQPAQPAQEDPVRANARQLGAQGIEAYWANDFVTADKQLDEAFRMFATPTLALWSARAMAKRDHWVEAAERYRQAIRTSVAVGDSQTQQQAQLDATKELHELNARIPTVMLLVPNADPSTVTVILDDATLPNTQLGVALPLNTGSHQISVLQRGQRRDSAVRLVERDRKVLRFEFAAVTVEQPAVADVPPAREPAPEPVHVPNDTHVKTAVPIVPIAIAALAVGAVGLATSGITALVASGHRSACHDNMCTKQSDLDAYNSARTASTVSFYVGAAFAVGGAATWLIASRLRSEERSAVSWRVGPTSVSVHGQF